MQDVHRWEIKPSFKQKQSDVLVWLVLSTFVLALKPTFWIVVALCALLGGLFLLWHSERQITHIGVQDGALYVFAGQKKRFINIRTGSAMYAQSVKLCYSWLPHNTLILKADSFHSALEFKHFKRALYALF